jgi:putative transposase
VEPETAENLRLMRLIDEQYTRTPFYGIRKMGWWLGEQGYVVNAKRVRRLMRQMGLEAIYPKPRLSVPGSGHKIYPYRLRSLKSRSARPRLGQRYHLHPTAAGICLSGGDHGLVQPLCAGVGSIDFVGERLLRGGTGLGIDDDAAGDLQYRPRSAVHQRGFYEPSRGAGHHDQRGRAIDNIFIERLWRTVKYEEVYLKDYVDVLEAVSNLKSYFTFYNHERPHQSLGYQTPAAIYFGKVKCV